MIVYYNRHPRLAFYLVFNVKSGFVQYSDLPSENQYVPEKHRNWDFAFSCRMYHPGSEWIVPGTYEED